MKKTALTSALLALGLAGASQAATTLFDTLTISDSGQATFLGQSFTTGTLGTDNKLSTVTLESANNDSSGVEDFNAHIAIYLDSNNDATDWGHSGTAIATSNSIFVTNAVPGAQFTFSFAGLPTLADNTAYLLEFVNEDNAGATTRIAFGGDPATTGSTSGNAFISVSAGGGTAIAGSDFAVQVTAVPEPSSAALIGLGSLALILRRRK